MSNVSTLNRANRSPKDKPTKARTIEEKHREILVKNLDHHYEHFCSHATPHDLLMLSEIFMDHAQWFCGDDLLLLSFSKQLEEEPSN